LFWKRTSANAALWSVILSIPLSMLIKYLLPEFPFMDRMGVVFLVSAFIIVLISLIENKGPDKKAIEYGGGLFATSMKFNAIAIAIVGLLAVIYAAYW
jgi:SSS family solute:Na+ symporter